MNVKVYLYGQTVQTQVMQQMLEKSEEITVVGCTDDENLVLEEIRKLNADVLMTYVDGSAGVYRVTQQIYMLRPQCVNFALVSQKNYARESSNILQSGIGYVYEDTLSEEELAAYLKNAYTVEESRRTTLEEGKTNMTSSKVYTFYSPKDGMGRTTFLMSLAAEMAKRKQKIIVLDFDLQFGDLHILNGIETKETLAEMLQERSEPTIDIIRQYVIYHKSGVNILCAPRNPEYAENIRSRQLEKLITALRPYYDYIFIDASTVFGEISFMCCEQANKVLLTVRPDIAALNHVKRIVTMLDSLNQKEKLGLLFCDYWKGAEIDLKKTEQVLGVPVWHTIPYDPKTAMEAINQGEPASSMFPKSVLARSCAEAAEKILHPKAQSVRGARKKK